MGWRPDTLYLALLFAFLVALRSPWPWTRSGGLTIFALVCLVGGWLSWQPGAVALFAGGEHLPVLALAALAGLVVWWSLHVEENRAARQKRRGDLTDPPPGEPRAGPGAGARQLGVAAGVVAVAAAAHLFPPPLPAGDVPWFLAGLAALAPLLGDVFIYGVVPVTAAVALLLAPSLDAHDPETRAPFSGRRDEVPFFLFAWLAVGVLPIVVATLRPDFGAAASPPLSTRFWLDWAGISLPSSWWLREMPGFLLYAAYFGLLPWRLPSWRATRGVFGRHLRRLGTWRYALVMILSGTMVLVPIKVLLHRLLGIGPWISWPGGGL